MFSSGKKNISILFLVVISILFSGCGSTSDRGCVPGDSFDGSVTEFDSKLDPFAEDFRDSVGRKIADNFDLIRWQDTGLVTNGDNIVVDILGRWSPWGQGPMITEKADVDKKTGRIVINKIISNKICKNFITKAVPTADGHTINGQYISLTEPVNEYPCWLSNGIGMYLLFSTGSDPNAAGFSIKNPDSGTVHLNKSTEPENSRFIIDIKSDRLKNSASTDVKITKGMSVYGKIYDSYYLDNYGTYQLNFISGVIKRTSKPIFQNCRDFILNPLRDLIQKIFINLTSDNAYRISIYALITLYIAITGLMYLMGLVQSQIGELSTRLFKIGMVFVMLTPNAWSFFYDNLFSAYLDGLEQLSSIISQGDKNYDPDNKMAFLDRSVDKILGSSIINPYLSNRLIAGFFANPLLGMFFALFMILIILAFAVCVIFSFACYIIGMILLYIATALFPIFVTMLLFNVTRQIFQEYLNTILGYSFQVVMTFVVLSFMAGLIQAEIQRALGFRMCVAPVINLNPFKEVSMDDMKRFKDDASSNNLSDNTVASENEGNFGLVIKHWVPGETENYSTLSFWSLIAIYPMLAVKRYEFDYSIVKMAVPPYYDQVKYRYKSLPFLEPDETLDHTKPIVAQAKCNSSLKKEDCDPDVVFPGGIGQGDHTRIKDMMFATDSFSFFNFGDLIIIILFIFVLWELCINYIRGISEYIAIGGEGYTQPEGTIGTSILSTYSQWAEYLSKNADGATGFKKIAIGFATFATTHQGIYNMITKKSVGKIWNALDDKAGDLRSKAIRGLIPESAYNSTILQEDNKGGFTGFMRQVGSAIYDSGRYDNVHSKTINESASDSVIEKDNMRGIHYLQDKIGSYFDYTKIMMDKASVSSLYRAMNPADSSTARLFGGYEWTPLGGNEKDKTIGAGPFKFQERSGVFGRIANAVAGDSINEYMEDKGYGKVFDHYEGDYENKDKYGDASKLERAGKAFSSISRALFTSDAENFYNGTLYDAPGNATFAEYREALAKDYTNHYGPASKGNNIDNPVQQNPSNPRDTAVRRDTVDEADRLNRGT
jgi:type IV secretory pathway VirB6-like protein